MITRDELNKPAGGGAYPPGEYELEIMEAVPIGGTNAKGEEWKKMELRTRIVSPEELDGRKFTNSLWYDGRMAGLLTVGLGKTLDEVFGKAKEIDESKLIGILEGSFIRVRIGVNKKTGYNEIVEALPPLDEKKTNKVAESV